MCLKGTLIWPKTVNGSIISDVQEADVNFPLPLYLYFTVLDLIWHDNPETERNDWAGIYNIISDFGSATQILDFPLKLQTLPKTILPLLTLNWDVIVGVMTPFQETSVWTGLFRLRSLSPLKLWSALDLMRRCESNPTPIVLHVTHTAIKSESQRRDLIHLGPVCVPPCKHCLEDPRLLANTAFWIKTSQTCKKKEKKTTTVQCRNSRFSF